MKKLIAVILACLCAASLAACRQNGEDPDNKVTETKLESTAPEAEKDTSDYEHPEPPVSDDTTEAGTKAETETDTEAVTNETTESVTEPVTEPDTDNITDSVDTTGIEDEPAVTDEMTAVKIAKEYLGERDPDVGYAYSFQFDGMTAEGEYKIKVSWYIEEDERFSTCGYLLVSPDGTVTKFDW